MNEKLVVTIVGARPQFIKAAAISRTILESAEGLTEQIIHTGQHHDKNMSSVFFEQLGIPAPVANLDIHGGSHGEMTGRMLAALECEMIARKPDVVLVYGDTNSTLAGALAAAKLHIPIAHVEAGLRSYNRRMPEEINRVMADHVSTLLFAPTTTAMENLGKEGLVDKAHHVGDVMYDVALMFGERAREHSTIQERLMLKEREYVLATVHRAENTDDASRLISIVDGLNRISKHCRVILPLHPRTRARLAELQCSLADLDIVDPVNYIDMVSLEQHSRLILTDSGGVQKEAYFHGVPCITLRDETEWVETVTHGWNQLVGADSDQILAAFLNARPGSKISEYGGGEAASRIASLISEELS